jgi:hypothetical protein
VPDQTCDTNGLPPAQEFGVAEETLMGTEPRRLAGRYLRYNSLFLYYLLRDRLSKPPQCPRGGTTT